MHELDKIFSGFVTFKNVTGLLRHVEDVFESLQMDNQSQEPI